MLGVDSLFPTTGLVHKLLAVEELFRREPELAETNVFVQVRRMVWVYLERGGLVASSFLASTIGTK
jgi:hypothetical protein